MIRKYPSKKRKKRTPKRKKGKNRTLLRSVTRGNGTLSSLLFSVHIAVLEHPPQKIFRSDVDEDSMDKKSSNCFHHLQYMCENSHDCFFEDEEEFNEVVGEAFDIFVERILGRSNPELKLHILHHLFGEGDPKLFIIYTPTKIEPDTGYDYRRGAGYAENYRGGVNVPWGQRAVDLPMQALDSKKVSDEIRKICDALGVTCIGKPSWKIISMAGVG